MGLETLLTTLLPALIPAVGDGVRGIIAKFTGSAGAAPQNVEEQVTLLEAQTRQLQALAELDKPQGQISLWVANLRASARYLATFAVILNGIGQAAFNNDPEMVRLSLNLAEGGFFFLFGDRVYLHLKKGR